MFSNFSYELKKILKMSEREMKDLKHSYLGTEHFILSLLKSNNDIKDLLSKYNITYALFRNMIIENIGIGNETNKVLVFTPLFKKILESAMIITNELKLNSVEINTVFKLILDEGEGVAYRIFCELNVDIDNLYDEINSIIVTKKDDFLDEIGYDLTLKAEEGLIDPVIGREKEINIIIEVLLRKNKRNPLLIGEAGVGKTAIVEALASRIVNGNVPDKLLHKRIISISISSVVAGTKYRGEFEEKLLKIIDKIKNNHYILFIDEMHTLVGAGGAEGAIDASNILKPALARDDISIIGATTIEEYKKNIEDDKAFSRRFQKILVMEPDEKETYNILKNIKNIYEKHHNVAIKNDILKYLIKMSNKYFNYKKEPDRSIDLLDEVSSKVASKSSKDQLKFNRLKNELNKYKSLKKNVLLNNDYMNALLFRTKERNIESKINKYVFESKNNNILFITKDDINELISNKYGIKVGNKKEISKQFNKNNEYKNILSSIEKLFICDCTITKPISLLFSGNDLKKIEKVINYLKTSLFSNNYINIDMVDYSDDQSLNKMIGAAPGYIGFNNKTGIFESLKERPIQLIVIDNYDKGSEKVKELINEILNKGYFIDSSGNKIIFLNSLIIIKSNEDIKKTIGFNQSSSEKSNNVSSIVEKTIIFNKELVSMI